MLLSPGRAVTLLKTLLVLIVVFHISVLAGFIPMDFVWGGRVQYAVQMQWLEVLSVAVNSFLWYVLFLKSRFLRQGVSAPRWIDRTIALFVAIFLLNTMGNFCASSPIEQIAGALLTLFMAWLCLSVVVRENKKARHG